MLYTCLRWSASARAHVHTPLPYLANGWADCVQTWCVANDPLDERLTQVRCGVHLRVRTCTPPSNDGASSPARPSPINPRTAGGGHICAPPHRFFADSRKMAARSAAKFGIAVQSSFAHLVLKFLTPGHIRSGLQVTLSDVTSKRNLATLTPCHSHSYEPSVFKLLEVDEVNSSSNLYISDFVYS